MPDGNIVQFTPQPARQPAPVQESDDHWGRVEHMARLYPEIFAVIRAHRANCNDGCEECRDPNGPLMLADVARAARHLADIAWSAIKEAGRNQCRAREGSRSKYVTPPDRPWDRRDVDDGESVSDFVNHLIEQAQLSLIANDPEDAGRKLKFAAGQIKDGIARAWQMERAKERSEREAKRRERQRQEIEAEERRLARERERARKRIAVEGAV